MSAAVWLHDGPVGSGPGAVRLPAIAECRPDFPSDMPWVPACGSLDGCTMAGRPHERRVVSPVVDLPEETCPTCGGVGWIVEGQTHEWPYGEQVQCTAGCAEGTIRRLWHAVEQWRYSWEWPWEPEPPPVDWMGSDWERRLVVVGYSDTRVLDVVPYVSEHANPVPDCVVAGEVENFTVINERTTVVTDEPWAADLVSGDRVLRWESVVMLDQPLISMLVPYEEHPELRAQHRLVPLQLAPGWNPSVELETP